MPAVILLAGTAVLCGVDLWCKSYAEKHLRDKEEREICSGKISLRKVHNKGMALGIGSRRPKLVRIAAGVLCAFLGVYAVILFRKKGDWIGKTGIMCILAGGISNCYDRFTRTYVVDYFGFRTKWKKLSDITYNLGDMFIFLGTALYLVSKFKKGQGYF